MDILRPRLRPAVLLVRWAKTGCVANISEESMEVTLYGRRSVGHRACMCQPNLRPLLPQRDPQTAFGWGNLSRPISQHLIGGR